MHSVYIGYFITLLFYLLHSSVYVRFNVWVHVMASWGSRKFEARMYINGEMKGLTTVSGSLSDTSLTFTSHKVFDIGLDRNKSAVFHGYIRDLAVYGWAIINQQQVWARKGK